ncbi:MAG: CoA-binding protein [Pseudomonadota bacterium]
MLVCIVMRHKLALKTVAQILEQSKTIAVVGLSPKAQRASFGVAQYMQEQGYRILPVNPSYAGAQILGETVHASLAEAAAALAPGQRIDIVDCFRKAEDIGTVAEQAIAVGACCLWMQLGIVNMQAAALAEQAGLDVVMDRCIKVDHAMLG